MKVNQRVALTKRLIQEALLKLLETKSIDKINVTELCGESGINRATFYRHYDVPRDVLAEMENALTEEMAAKFGMILMSEGQHGYSYIENVCAYVYDHADIIKVLISNGSMDDLMRAANRMFNKFVAMKTQSSKTVGVEDDAIQLFSTYVVGGSFFIIRQWLVEDIRKTPEEIAQMLVKFANYTPVYTEPK